MIGSHVVLPTPGVNLIDAKGDLIVGTGAGTVDRLPIGTDGRALLADSSATLGESWHTPTHTLIPAVGDYITYPHVSRTAAAQGTGTGYAPIWIPHTMTFDRISCEVTTTDAAGVIRLGVWAHNYTTQRPDALVLDAGTLSGTAVAVVEATINLTLEPGLYWLSGTGQNGPTTLQVRKMLTSPGGRPWNTSASSGGISGSSVQNVYVDANVIAGALPSNASPTANPSTQLALIALRRSA